MVTENCYDFSQKQFEKEFERFYNSYKFGITPVAAPTAYLLGGQSGSGKSTIHKIILKSDPNTIVIDGDRFRERHPYFKEIQKEYGREAANYTQPFVNKMVEALIERFSNEKYNLIIEGTCRSISVPLNTCDLLKSKGYAVNLAVMCTDKDVAWQSTIDRYNEMETHGLLPRAVPRDKYDKMVAVLPGNISKLYNSKKFDDIILYNRSKERLYSYKEQPGRDPGEIVARELNEIELMKNALKESDKVLNANPQLKGIVSKIENKALKTLNDNISETEQIKQRYNLRNSAIKSNPKLKEEYIKARDNLREISSKKELPTPTGKPNHHRR